METIEYFKKKFGVDVNKTPIVLDCGRGNLPEYFRELGFKVGAEVGVYEGAYSIALAKGIPNLKLYLVDAWQPYKGYKDFDGVEEQRILPEAYQTAQKNLKGFDCVFLKGWSDEMVNQFEDGSLDFVYIDSNHDFEHAVRDISLWEKKVRKGGIVAGHDYKDRSKTGRWRTMQVKEAVDAWVSVKKIRPLFITSKDRSNSWLYIKNE